MDRISENVSDSLTYISFIFVFVATISQNIENRGIILFLSIVLLASFLYKDFILYRLYYEKLYTKKIKKFLFFELFIICFIFYFDKSNTSMIYFLILTSHSVFYFSTKKGILFTMLAYVLFNITARTKSVSISLDQVFMILVVNAFPFVLIFMFSFLIKRQMMQRTIIEKTTKELEEKNKMLEKSYEALQEMAIIKERNRIAGEIHDTVGHTLTTVLIEIEASKRLIEKDKNLALEKLTLAQNQVKKGLNEIRSSVKKMSSENKKEDLKIFLEEIIQESEKHTDIKINKNISLYSKFDEKINNIIINALKEGITNGIKHGKATVFNFFIREDEKNIFFTLNNNGLGNIKTNLGFGLSNMKTKIEDIKGTININSQPDKGFTLTIKIPKNI